MALYQLKLLQVPSEARPQVVDAARSCGPPLDRAAFNSVLMGTARPPVVIATSEERGKIIALKEILGDAGASLEIVEGVAAAGAGIGPLLERARALPMPAKVGAGAGLVLLLGLIVALGSGEEELPADARPSATVHTTTTATVATATVVREIVAAPPPTPFIELIAKLKPEAERCVDGEEHFACLLVKLRTLGAAIPPPPPDAGMPPDSGEIDDAGEVDAGPPPPPEVSPADYLAALDHRFVRCLADEGGAPAQGEREPIERAIRSLVAPLVYRFGKPACTASRREMYDCTSEVREASCARVYGRLMGALIETANRDRVGRAAAEVAQVLGDHLLRCAGLEREGGVEPIERAYVHVYRYAIADAAAEARGRCSEPAFLACAATLSRASCGALEAALDPSAKRFVEKALQACPAVAACR